MLGSILAVSLLTGNTSVAYAPSVITTEYWLVGGNSFRGSAAHSKGYSSQVLAYLVDYDLEALAMCESSNNPLAVNWHDRGSPSYGLLQFKETTWTAKIRQYGLLPQAENAELMNWIWDEDLQMKLAKLILEEKNGWKNWFNCLK